MTDTYNPDPNQQYDWKFVPRKKHGASYPLNPHASFNPQYPHRGYIVWQKTQDVLSYERIWKMNPMFVYPETCVTIQEREMDGAFIVWVTSTGDEYRWQSKSFTNLDYAKKSAMKFRYAIDPLTVALTVEPQQDYKSGERVQCCNASKYPDLQLGYNMGTVVSVLEHGADMVTVQFDGHTPEQRHRLPMRIDHIYSIESKTFSIWELLTPHGKKGRRRNISS